MLQASAQTQSSGPADLPSGVETSGSAVDVTTSGGALPHAFSDPMVTNTETASQFMPSEGLEMLAPGLAAAGIDLMAAALETESLPPHDGALEVGEILHDVGAALEFVSAFEAPLAGLTGPFVLHTGRILGRLLETPEAEASNDEALGSDLQQAA